MVRKRSIRKPPTAEEIENLDYSQGDLSGSDFSGYSFSDCDFSSADLTNANLTNANLTDCDLSNADLTNANLTDCDLSNADLSNADLTNANLTGANLTDCDLSSADLTNSDFRGANVSECFFDDADFTNCVGLDLEYAEEESDDITIQGGVIGGMEIRGGSIFFAQQNSHSMISNSTSIDLGWIRLVQTEHDGSRTGYAVSSSGMISTEIDSRIANFSRGNILFRAESVGRGCIRFSLHQLIDGELVREWEEYIGPGKSLIVGGATIINRFS